MAKKVKWIGTTPNRCDLCGGDLNKGEHFYDFETNAGPWALGCKKCFETHGRGLGTGKGQKYKTATREQVTEGS